jgi:ribosome biogenesis GTPase A
MTHYSKFCRYERNPAVAAAVSASAGTGARADTQAALVVQLVDLLDVAGTLPARAEGPVLVGTKLDLLPAGASASRLAGWLRRQAPAWPRHFLVSSRTGIGFRRLQEALCELARGRTVRVQGRENVGKSSLINRLAHRTGHEALLTSSIFPGTTLAPLEVPLPRSGLQLCDMPGEPMAGLAALLDAEEFAALVPKRRLRPFTLRLAEGKSVFVGGLARLDLLRAPTRGYVLLTSFLPPALRLHATSAARASEVYARQLGRLLVPPALSLEDFPPLAAHPFEASGSSWDRAALDICLPGLGHFALTLEGSASLVLHLPRGIPLQLRTDVMMPFDVRESLRKGRLRRHGRINPSRAFRRSASGEYEVEDLATDAEEAEMGEEEEEEEEQPKQEEDAAAGTSGSESKVLLAA